MPALLTKISTSIIDEVKQKIDRLALPKNFSYRPVLIHVNGVKDPLGAEYLLNIVPRGTHSYSQFIRPSELTTWAETAGFTLKQLSGLRYNPLTQQASLYTDVSVNYLAHFCLSS
ncbi:MAG: hypothetical protein HY939_01570 [Gammaproteobacteria bacterium]|nr:hypothetical protein [Gammaproteobacteria bacterium]